MALIQTIDRQTKTNSQLAEAINRLAASNEAMVNAMVEAEDEDEHARFHLDGSPVRS